VVLWLCKSEGEVRQSLNGSNGEERARWKLSPRRGDGVGGMAEFPVRGGAPMVGAVRKATGRGVLPVGCFGVRTEEGKGTEAQWRRAAPFERSRGEAGVRWGSWNQATRGGHQSTSRGPGPDRWGTARAARQWPARPSHGARGWRDMFAQWGGAVLLTSGAWQVGGVGGRRGRVARGLTWERNEVGQA
jgi:hypothetical protein